MSLNYCWIQPEPSFYEICNNIQNRLCLPRPRRPFDEADIMRQSHPDSLHLGAVAAERIDNRPGQGRRSDCTAIQIGVQYGAQGCHVYIFQLFLKETLLLFPYIRSLCLIGSFNDRLRRLQQCCNFKKII